MGHHHHHGHSHAHDRAAGRKRLAWTLGLTTTYMVAEVVGGYLADSLALLADAGHMFSDAGAIALSLFASWISQRPATAKLTFGYHRAEILAALFNGATLIAIAILIFIEAIKRLAEPEPVAGLLMLSVAAGGLLINIVGLVILNAGKSTNLNIRGAWLHLLTDALGSVAALTAGTLIWAFGWNWADAVASIAIGLLVIYSSWDLLKQAIAILMQGTPSHLELDQVQAAMLEVESVADVHDLHIWTITSGMESLSAHAVLRPGFEHEQALDTLRRMLHDRFGIDHVTIQVERHCSGSACG